MLFLLPINERDNEGSHPFHYESTEKSVIGKQNKERENTKKQKKSLKLELVIT